MKIARFLIIAVSLQLIACQITHLPEPIVQVPIIRIPPTEQLVFEIQSTDLFPIEAKPIPDKNEIDPLTDYIQSYQHDLVMYPYVQKVEIQRDEKCEQVAQYYENIQLDQTVLNEIAGNYSYSCPHLVATLILQLEQVSIENESF